MRNTHLATLLYVSPLPPYLSRSRRMRRMFNGIEQRPTHDFKERLFRAPLLLTVLPPSTEAPRMVSRVGRRMSDSISIGPDTECSFYSRASIVSRESLQMTTETLHRLRTRQKSNTKWALRVCLRWLSQLVIDGANFQLHYNFYVLIVDDGDELGPVNTPAFHCCT